MSDKRAVLYYRVSTFDQHCENQVPDLHRYCAFRNWKIEAEFKDEGISGTKQTRPQLEKMMMGIRRGLYDVLLVWSYDRFARSMIHLVTTLDQLRSLGVDFASFREQLDTTTPEGRMMFQFFALMAEFERNRTAVRTRATLARMKAEGKRLGRPIEYDSTMIERIWSDRKKGLSIRAIAREIEMSPAFVHKVLTKAA